MIHEPAIIVILVVESCYYSMTPNSLVTLLHKLCQLPFFATNRIFRLTESHIVLSGRARAASSMKATKALLSIRWLLLDSRASSAVGMAESQGDAR